MFDIYLTGKIFADKGYLGKKLCALLSELNNLQELNLNVNPIKDLSPFRNLSKLIDLDIGHNQIIDLTSISNYKELASKAASTDVQIPLSCL